MKFCNVCNSVYTITKKDDKLKNQKGGSDTNFNISNIIKKSLNKQLTKNDVNPSLIKKIKKNSEFKKLDSNSQEYVFNNIYDLIQKKKNIKDISNDYNAYFYCNNCGNQEKIEKKTCIFIKRTDKLISERYINPKEIIKSNIIHKTINYTCPNDKCQTKKNKDLKKASFYRSNGYKTKYICDVCYTMW